MDKTRKEIEEMFVAMETPEKWDKFVRAKNKTFTGQIDKDKAEKFADYVTQRFIDACNDKTVFGSFQNWQTKTVEEKISITDKILKAFIQNIKDDITNNKITIHTRDGSEFHTDKSFVEENYKEDILSSIPNITVKNRSMAGSMMGVSHDKILYINFTFPFYEANTAEFFLMDLNHEFTHIIDMFIPTISYIHPDTLTEAQMFYVSPKSNDSESYNLYENNPLELNANQKRKDLRIKIEQMLQEQDNIITQRTNGTQSR